MKSAEEVDFTDLEAFAKKARMRRPARAVGGILRAFYLKHPERVRPVRGTRIEGRRHFSLLKPQNDIEFPTDRAARETLGKTEEANL